MCLSSWFAVVYKRIRKCWCLWHTKQWQKFHMNLSKVGKPKSNKVQHLDRTRYLDSLTTHCKSNSCLWISKAGSCSHSHQDKHDTNDEMICNLTAVRQSSHILKWCEGWWCNTCTHWRRPSDGNRLIKFNCRLSQFNTAKSQDSVKKNLYHKKTSWLLLSH